LVSSSPRYQDGYVDQPFADVDGALDYADQTRDGFRKDGHKVTEVDRREDDKSGVIERYRAADGEGATVAIVVVRPCYKGRCLLERSYHSLPVEVALSGGHWLRPRS
jgi:hypothetical protein